MKKLITLALLCAASIGAKAQAGSVRVINTSTTCNVYFTIKGDKKGSCGTPAVSSLITLGPGSSVTYPTAASVPGLGLAAGDWMNAADVYVAPPSCGITPALYSIGEPCTGLSASAIYNIYNASCKICHDNIVAKWNATSTPGGMATLTFN